MKQQVSIPERFKGPPVSGHGGYSCALAAQFVDGPAEVTLRRPPPLERPLEVRREGEAIGLLDGETVVAEARPVALELDVPAPVTVHEAEDAAQRSPLLEAHPFGTCFVCGTEREAGDGLRLFSGPVDGRDLYAVPWTPEAELAVGGGTIRDEFVWSVLDCPSGVVAMFVDTPRLCVLARFAVRQLGPVDAGEQHVLLGWRIGQERRKFHSGAAIFTAEGKLRAFARALWIELTDEQRREVGTTSSA